MKKNKKLVGTHYVKKDHLISLPLLQLYLELGLEIEKIHTIHKFKQSSHIKEFIEGNVAARHTATSKDEQKAFKAMSNSVFGHCLMNPVKYNQKSTIIPTKDKFLKAVRDPDSSPTSHLEKIEFYASVTNPK